MNKKGESTLEYGLLLLAVVGLMVCVILGVGEMGVSDSCKKVGIEVCESHNLTYMKTSFTLGVVTTMCKTEYGEISEYRIDCRK